MTLNLPSFGSPVTMLTPSRDLTLFFHCSERKSRSLSIEYMDVDMSRSRVDPPGRSGRSGGGVGRF